MSRKNPLPKLRQVKTIDLYCQESMQGSNTRFAARVVLNFGMPSEHSFRVGPQYGYETAYEQTAMQALMERYPRCAEAKEKCYALHRFGTDRGIIVRSFKWVGTKREMMHLLEYD